MPLPVTFEPNTWKYGSVQPFSRNWNTLGRSSSSPLCVHKWLKVRALRGSDTSLPCGCRETHTHSHPTFCFRAVTDVWPWWRRCQWLETTHHLQKWLLPKSSRYPVVLEGKTGITSDWSCKWKLLPFFCNLFSSWKLLRMGGCCAGGRTCSHLTQVRACVASARAAHKWELSVRCVLRAGSYKRWFMLALGCSQGPSGPGKEAEADGVHLPTGCSSDGCWETDPAPAVCDRDVTCAYERICWTLRWVACSATGIQPASDPHIVLSCKCWSLSWLPWHYASSETNSLGLERKNHIHVALMYLLQVKNPAHNWCQYFMLKITLRQSL